MESLADGVQRYCRSWYQLDQRYRKFIYHVRKSGQSSLLEALAQQIENLYSNGLSAQGQRSLAGTGGCSLKLEYPHAASRSGVSSSTGYVPFLNKGIKVCVVISDAMRYEIGDELLSLIRQEDRYSAELEPALSMLPSYTQLGMAALLPNRELAIGGQRDGQCAGRWPELAGHGEPRQDPQGGAGRVGRSGDSRRLSGDESRRQPRPAQVQQTWCTSTTTASTPPATRCDSEDQVFEAAEQTLDELLRLVKKLTGANASNILVTADHGFIYQHRAIEESDFSATEPEGDDIRLPRPALCPGQGLEAEARPAAFHRRSSSGLPGIWRSRCPSPSTACA